MAQQLNPCPFCGSRDGRLRFKQGEAGGLSQRVYCTGCGAIGAMGDGRSAAAGVWNSRPGERALRKRAAESRKSLRMKIVDLERGVAAEPQPAARDQCTGS